MTVQIWDRLAEVNPPPILNTFYPAQYAIGFLSAYAATGGSRWADMARVQLEYAASLEDHNLLLVGGRVHRDMQSRQIIHYYHAYKILGDILYWNRAVYCADRMFGVIPRAPHAIAGETFSLFTSEFVDPGAPAATLFTVDCNQNSGVGLALALLASDPRPFPQGVTLTKANCQAMALEETMASMVLQNEETGAIPLSENDARPDTLYGSYAAFCWTWTAMLDIFGPEYRQWRPRFFQHISAASGWLRPNLATGSDRYYPDMALGAALSPQEYTWRRPMYRFCCNRWADWFEGQVNAYIRSPSVDYMDSYNAAKYI